MLQKRTESGSDILDSLL